MKVKKKTEGQNTDVKELVRDVAKEVMTELIAEKEAKKKEDKKKQKATAPTVLPETISDEKRAVGYLKAMVKGDKAGMAKYGQKDMTTGSISIPQGWANEIDHLMGEESIARNYSRVVPMPTKSFNVPKGSAVAVQWLSEGSDATAHDSTFTNTQLTAKDLVAYSKVSMDLVEDANADVIDFLNTLFVEAIAKEENNQWLNGTGASPAITGILQSSSVTSVVLSSSTTLAGATNEELVNALVDTVHAVKSRHRKNGAWFLSDYALGIIRKLKDDNKRPIYQALTEAEPGRLLGYPTVVVDDAPDSGDDGASTAMIAFGNTKRGMLFGDRKRYSFAVSTDRYFEANMLALRMVERVDMAVHQAEYMAKLVTHA